MSEQAGCCGSHIEQKDPVCGMLVKQDAEYQANHNGQWFGFCCKGCLDKFTAEPEIYLSATTVPVVEAIEGANYICPMCPGIESEKPDICSKCGMALEAETFTLPEKKTVYSCPMHSEIEQDEAGVCPRCGMALEAISVIKQEENPELTDMSWRFRVSLFFTLPLFLVAMSDMLPSPPLMQVLSASQLQWLQLLLATPVCLWAGLPFLERAVASLKTWNLNMFTLIGLGVSVSWLYSVVALFAPQAFPADMLTKDGVIAVYFEASSVIISLVLLGQVLELKARSQTNGALLQLLGLSPNTARKVGKAGLEEDVPLDTVVVGDVLRVRPGDKVPLDGTVLKGSSAVDEAMLTGEAMPIEKTVGNKLVAGTVNGTGSFLMTVEQVGKDTVLSQIIVMVGQAQRSRAAVQQLADKVSAWFVPVVVLVSFITFFLWLNLAAEQALALAVVNAVAVLIIACPCALGLATPMSIMVGMGRGAASGVLIKNADVLERMEKIDTVVVDKTGTLTEGKPSVTKVLTLNDYPADSLLLLAGSLEKASEHPLAEALVKELEGQPLEEVTSFKSYSGLGVSGQVDNKRILVGNLAFLKQQGVEIELFKPLIENHTEQAETLLYVAMDEKPAGIISLKDQIKTSAAEAILALKKRGLKLVVLTGDERSSADVVAKKLGISEVFAGVLPAQKVEIVKRLQATGKLLAMVGDGVNDAPALAQADVGIAMGTGSGVAIESAGITLLKGDLNGLVKAHGLSQVTMSNIRQNMVFAFFYNMLGVPIAAGALYPLMGVLLSPMLAAAAMSLSSVSVIVNALRLKRVRLD